MFSNFNALYILLSSCLSILYYPTQIKIKESEILVFVIVNIDYALLLQEGKEVVLTLKDSGERKKLNFTTPILLKYIFAHSSGYYREFKILFGYSMHVFRLPESLHGSSLNNIGVLKWQSNNTFMCSVS